MVFWILLGIFALLVYFFNQHVHSYWSKIGIPYKEPTFLIGETGSLLSMKESFGDFFANLYNTYKDKRLLGIYFIHRPHLVITDPLLIQDVMIKEFSSFHDRGFAMDENVDPLANHLFGLDGQKWRDLRVKLSPTFTTGKLKGMYPVILNCAQTLKDFIAKENKNGIDVFDIRDLFARFTTSVISSVAFGIENDCINDPENTFRKMGLKINQPTFKQAFQNIVASFLPELANFLKFKQVPQDVEDFFMSLVKDTIEYREKNKNYVRKDFMQLLIQLKNQGYVSVDKDEEIDENIDKSQKNLEIKKLTFNEVAAQTFLFFVAGNNYFK
jgi:cytochrome P450 family 6